MMGQMFITRRPFTPPSVLPDISPSGGEITPAACPTFHSAALAIGRGEEVGMIYPH
jgi:hypothetical protein